MFCLVGLYSQKLAPIYLVERVRGSDSLYCVPCSFFGVPPIRSTNPICSWFPASERTSFRSVLKRRKSQACGRVAKRMQLSDLCCFVLQDIARSVTRVAIKEARAKELKLEILNSERYAFQAALPHSALCMRACELLVESLKWRGSTSTCLALTNNFSIVSHTANSFPPG